MFAVKCVKSHQDELMCQRKQISLSSAFNANVSNNTNLTLGPVTASWFILFIYEIIIFSFECIKQQIAPMAQITLFCCSWAVPCVERLLSKVVRRGFLYHVFEQTIKRWCNYSQIPSLFTLFMNSWYCFVYSWITAARLKWEHKELNRFTQRGCGFSVLGGIEKLTGLIGGQLAPGDWTRWPPEIPSSLNHSVIHWKQTIPTGPPKTGSLG